MNQTTTIEYEPAFAENNDITFILKHEEILSTEVVGFYYGRPDEKATAQFIGKLKATFVEDECGGYFDTDGYHVTVPTEDGEREVTEVIPQHKTLQQTLAACLYRLQATYTCNHEYMDADDLGDLLTTIEDVKYYMTTED